MPTTSAPTKATEKALTNAPTVPSDPRTLKPDAFAASEAPSAPTDEPMDIACGSPLTMKRANDPPA